MKYTKHKETIEEQTTTKASTRNRSPLIICGRPGKGLTTLKHIGDKNYIDFNRISEQKHTGEIVITGCPTDDEGQVYWKSMGDLFHRPYSHGFIDSLGAIGQMIKLINVYMWNKQLVGLPKLTPRFEANIRDVFKPDSNLRNPTIWIHLGHGHLEEFYELLEDLEEWEEEIVPVPGISNGNDDDDFISARELRDAISSMQGEILFMALPICYGKQISQILIESQSIHYSHAPYDFSVDAGKEFYDCDESGILPEHTLTAWSSWVRRFETALPSALVERRGKEGRHHEQ